ncbi:MAG: hypothetical protein RI926_898 [Actinomycetota bacterium]|jgi:hypothetical protein
MAQRQVPTSGCPRQSPNLKQQHASGGGDRKDGWCLSKATPNGERPDTKDGQRVYEPCDGPCARDASCETGSVQRTIGGATVQQELKPGAVFELHEGEKTVWTVSQSVRKIYLS